MINNVCKVGLIACLFSFSVAAENVEQGLAKCAKVTQSTERLACFDKLASSFKKVKTAATTAAPIVKAAPKATQEKVAEFGEHHLAQNEKNNEKLERVTFKISKVDYSASKKLKLTFDNGQSWHQTDGQSLRVKKGDEVELFKGVWSAIYLKKVGQNRKIRVKRVK